MPSAERSLRRLGTCLLLLLACGEPPADGAPKLSSDGGGTATIAPARTAIRSREDWTLAFETDGEGIRPGGAVRFRVWPEWGWASPQIDRPEKPGYVRWVAHARHAVFEGSVRTDPRAKLATLVLRLAEGALRPGERLEIHYAARAGRFAGTARHFLLEVDAEGNGAFRSVAVEPPIEVLPGSPASVWVVAPAGAAPGQRVAARASVLDPWGNLVRTRAVEGEPPVVRAHDPETGLTGHSSRIWPLRVGERRLFWGDVHGHSAWSDGTGQPTEYYGYARDAAGLDFAALTDHDAIGPRALDPDSWKRLRDVADAFDEPGRFVTLHGYEYTNWKTGHLTVLSPSRELPVFSAADAETDRVEELMAKLSALPVPVLAVPHHPGGSSMPMDWDHFDPRFMHVVEIFSVHGSSECYECPIRLLRPYRGSFVRDALLRGYRLSFIGSGDTHNGHPGRRTRREPRRTGLVGAWADELTRDAIWEALASGRTFATTGSRTAARLEADGSALRVDVRAASQVASVEIVKRDRVVFRHEAREPEVRLDWVDPEPPAPGDFYYLRVTETDGQMAWTSPIYAP